jgi:hypothetical protein
MAMAGDRIFLVPPDLVKELVRLLFLRQLYSCRSRSAPHCEMERERI